MTRSVFPVGTLMDLLLLNSSGHLHLFQRMWVIDCDTQEILSKVDTGDSPVHAYAIPSREEVWTHPDTSEYRMLASLVYFP